MGDELATATLVQPCESNDKMGSLHLNWPLAGDIPPAGRRHEQVPLHRLLAMTFKYAPEYGLPPWHTDLVVDHEDKVHQCNILSNLALMLKPAHDKKRKRAS
jgi:hypothetical protein